MVWDAGDHENDRAGWPTLRLSDDISGNFTRLVVIFRHNSDRPHAHVPEQYVVMIGYSLPRNIGDLHRDDHHVWAVEKDHP